MVSCEDKKGKGSFGAQFILPPNQTTYMVRDLIQAEIQGFFGVLNLGSFPLLCLILLNPTLYFGLNFSNSQRDGKVSLLKLHSSAIPSFLFSVFCS